MLDKAKLGLKNIYSTFADRKKSSRKFLYRMIWLACISVCIPIILAGSIYYQISMDRTAKQIKADSQSSLSLAMTRMERVLQNIEKGSFQLANNPYFKASFVNPEFHEDIFSHMNILDAILLEKSASDFIEEIYYFNNETEVVLSNKYGFIKLNDFKYRTDIEDAMKMERQASWRNFEESSKEGYISYITQLPLVSITEPHGLIIVQVRKEALESYFMDNLRLSDIQSAYILGSDGKILFNTNAREALKSSEINNLTLDNIVNDSSSSGGFFDKDSFGKPVFYTFTRALFGRTYITMTPKDELAKKSNWIRWFTLLIILVPLSIGIILTIINSRRVYNPIEQLLNYGYSLSHGQIMAQGGNEITYIKECLDYLNKEAKTLETYVKKVRPSLREALLIQLLTGSYDNSNNTLHKDCEAHNIPANKNYVVLIVDIEDFQVQKTPGTNDKLMATVAIASVMRELLSHADKSLSGHIVNISQSRNAAVLYISQAAGYDDAIHAVYEYGSQIRIKVLEDLLYTASVGIGRIYPNIADIAVSYNEAAQALQYRVYKDAEAILYIDDVGKQKKQSGAFYPHELEKSIVVYLDSGDINKAERALMDFSNIVKSSESYNFIRQSYQMLLSAIIFSFEEKGGSILDLLENNLFDQLKECQTSREIFNWFINNLFPMYNRLVNENQNTNGKTVILKICKYIKTNIVEDISLVQCSELVGMSPSYISRLFKKEMGMSFLDFVIKCKVDEVKRLLMETDDGISEIAVTVGYSERNLYRIFQRCTKMSPNEFRLINR